jgi:hypothetical protein
MVSSQNYADVFQSSVSAVQNAASNGRVDLMSAMPSLHVVPAHPSSSTGNYSFQKQALKGGMGATCLSDLYFSRLNVDAIQEGLRYKIYTETNGKHVIGRQSDQSLMIIMRSIYLQFAQHLQTDLVAQVRELNRRVLEWAVPEVLSNLKQFDVYRRDASTLPTPMDYGSKQTMKGSKQLEMKPFF